MTDVSISIGAVMKPAGLEASEGMLSAGYLKDAPIRSGRTMQA